MPDKRKKTRRKKGRVSTETQARKSTQMKRRNKKSLRGEYLRKTRGD